jgi:RNA polymerase sigma factor (sigma-70 family)
LLLPVCSRSMGSMATNNATPETRSSLIQRVSELDPESWREFVMLYTPLLLAYIGSCDQHNQLGLDIHDREDIKQEVLIKLYHKLSSFKTQRRFRTWLWSVVCHVVIDWVRQQRGRRKREKAGVESGISGRPQVVSLTARMEETLAGDESDAPDQQLIEAHDRLLLRHVLDKVKAEMGSASKWECFEMHYLQGEPSSKVAEKLGLSVSAVNTNTCRVRARIQQWCEHYEVEL